MRRVSPSEGSTFSTVLESVLKRRTVIRMRGLPEPHGNFSRRQRLAVQKSLHLSDRFSLPMAGKILVRAEAGAAHAIHVENPRHMIDFVLKNARVPSCGSNHFGPALSVEIVNLDRARAGHQGHQAG